MERKQPLKKCLSGLPTKIDKSREFKDYFSILVLFNDTIALKTAFIKQLNMNA